MTTKITLNNIADTALATLTGPKVTTIVYPGTETATDVAGGATINLTGGGFQSGCSVLVASTASSVVTFISSTQISFVAPALAAGTYVIYVINPDGGTAISIPGISYSGTPNWTTTAGSLGNAYETGAISTTLTATGDSPITYTLASGTLPTGSTLASNGTISGTAQATASAVTYSFTVTAKDAQNQTTNRSFSLTINPDVVTWSTPTASATYSVEKDSVMANVTMSATSAAGGSITYTADTLPTGLSITGANIAGTPTVTANTTTTLTATATSTRAATRTINWVVSVASDTYFKNTTLLLSGNGTNNQNNNTFLDSSTNNFTVARAGNTTQGTFSPYGSNWSTFFSSGNYISAASNAAFGFGTGDFTVEAWVFPNAAYTTYNYIYATGVTNGLVFYVLGGVLYVRQYGASDLLASSTAPALNTWTHVAATRSGTTLRIFVNGVQTGTTTNSTNFATGSGFVGNDGTNAAPWLGYISNMRVVKGTAVYTANFTPSTTPLTAIAGTSLLTCQSNRFIDNSSNAFALTVSGTPAVQRFSPFSPSAVYSDSTIGGSAYFDGTGDYLTVASNAAFTFGTGNFTIEGWFYFTNNNGALQTVWAFRSTTSNMGSPCLVLDGSFNITLYMTDSVGSWTAPNVTTGLVASLNQWQHIALVRSGNTHTVYKNGVAGTPYTYSTSHAIGGGLSLMSGSYAGGQEVQGYVSNFRMVKGTAVYTSAFTPPTAPVTAITNTAVLTNFTNAGIIDNTMMNNLETIGDAKISTTQSRFGGSSMYFDGTGDYLTLLTSPNLQFGTGDFTIELWTYFIARGIQGSNFINNYNNYTAGSLGIFAGHASGNTSKYQVSYNGGSFPSIQSSISIIYNQWAHIALVRSGTTITLYINGVADGTLTGASAALNGVGPSWIIGTAGDAIANYYVNGYIDDLRITKGYARYTSNFTPPTSAFNGR
jgi:hypothetical protein